MIPTTFDLSALQELAREVQTLRDSFTSRNINMEGRRVINAGEAVSPFDYVRKFELDKAKAALTSSRQQEIQGMLNSEATIRFGTFATRGAATAHINELFIANDLDYVAWLSIGSAWVYQFGVRSVAQSGIAGFTANLGTNDAGALINVTDFDHKLKWTGSATVFDDGDPGSGFIAAFAVAPTGGIWGICDGSAYTYLLADGTTASFTTPNLATAAYLTLGTSATVGPTAAGGATANTTATNQNESAHTHAVDPPSTTSGNNSASQEVQAGVGVTVADDPHTHDTDIGSFASGAGSAHTHTQDAHSHGPGTLELRRTQLIGYFRR